jgi:uracil-DNA glycosylase
MSRAWIEAQLRDSWPNLAAQLAEFRFDVLCDFLDGLRKDWSAHPRRERLFQAFRDTPFEKVKVVILGQDPYPDGKHAMGLAFSVPAQVKKLPSSLKQVYRELNRDPLVTFSHSLQGDGDLSCWAKHGVLLLNSALTVGRAKESHAAYWREFTDTALKLLNDRPEPVVFLFWGTKAWRKAPLVRSSQHFVRFAAHPRTGDFIGCGHFSQTDSFLQQQFPWNCVGHGVAASTPSAPNR